MLKTSINTFSGAVSGNLESKKGLTQNILPDMIIREQEGKTSNIMIDFKYLCSTSAAYQHGEDKFGGGEEVLQDQVKRSYRVVVQYLDFTENGNISGTIGPAEEILNTYGDRGSVCTSLTIGKHGNLSSAFLQIFATSSLNPSRVGIATTTASLLTMHRKSSNMRSTAVGDYQRPGHRRAY
jgi:hypothetical protein